MAVVISVVTLLRGVQSELSGVLPIGVLMIVVAAYLAVLIGVPRKVGPVPRLSWRRR
jgi:hypothetical protein